MASDLDVASYVAKSATSWTCIPLPEDITRIPDKPFNGMSISTLVNAPPHLLAHILRMKANDGVQVISPRATPMLATVQRIDPFTRQADHLVVTTQASANASWPTVDGRSLDALFPAEPNRSNGADAAQVTRTKTRAIGKAIAANSAADPVSRAIVRSAAVIDIQRRSDVAGDADALAEVLDVSWGLPMGTFATLAPLVLASSQDLLRTAIASDHNAPDLLTSVQKRKVIHVFGGNVSRASFGANVSMDWSRQRAVAKTIFALSAQLEGMNLLPTPRVWAAADMMAPIHSSQRDKHFVFQPAYGSGLSIDPAGFKFTMAPDPPRRFTMCLGLNPANTVMTENELANVLTAMVESGLPEVAAATVKETFRMNKITRLVLGIEHMPTVRVRGSDAAAVHIPSKAALALAHREVTMHLKTQLARGAAPGNVIRSRIYDIMQSVDSAALVPIFRTMAVMKSEAVRFDIPPKPYGLLRQLATRLSHSLGALVVQSLALEAERVGASLDEWATIANEVMPRPLRCDDCSTLGWATIAVWNMWSGTTSKWSGALKAASHSTMTQMASASMAAQYSSMTLEVQDPIFEAAEVALAGCKRLYAPYYESMYDYYSMLSKASPMLIPLGVGKTRIPYRVSESRVSSSIMAYTGACLWQFRGRHLRSAYLKKIPLGAPSTAGMLRRMNCVSYEIALMAAPNKAYEGCRKAIEAVLDPSEGSPMRNGSKGNVIEIMKSLPEPLFEEVYEACDGMFGSSRLARYVVSPARWAADMEKTYDEVILEVANAAMAVGMTRLGTITTADAGAIITQEMAAKAPASAPALARLAAAKEAEAHAGPAATVTIMAVSAFSSLGPVAGKSGWLYLKEIYKESAPDVIMDIEDASSEDEVDALLNTGYPTKEDFLAALDAFYGDDGAADPAASDAIGALKL